MADLDSKPEKGPGAIRTLSPALINPAAQDKLANKLSLDNSALLAAALVFGLSLVVYSLTLAPTVTLVDSGELIVASRSLGVAHPPGFPLYVLLASAFTLLPIGNMAIRVNFASAIFASLAAAAMTLLVVEMILSARPLPGQKQSGEQKGGRSKKHKKHADRAGTALKTQGPDGFHSVLLPALVSGLMLAFSRTLWSYATIAEVYTLNTLLLLVIFLLVFRWRRRALGDPAYRAYESRDRLLYAAAFVFGLALGVHHVTIALMLPALAALVFATEGKRFFLSRRLARAAGFAFAGLAIYLYLPVAALRSPLMNWGDPRTPERLWWHVTGRQYQVFFTFSAEAVFKLFDEFLKLAAREFGPVWLPAGLLLSAAGFLTVFRRDKAVFVFLALALLADLAYALNYEIAEDKDAYYLPAFAVAAIAAGFGARWLIEKSQSARLPSRAAALAASIALLLVPLAAMAGNLPYNDRSRYHIARDYVENIFSTIEPQGMLLTLDWQVYSPLLYVREVENHRRDIIAIDVNLLRRSWYFDYLGRAYPGLIEKARGKIDPFLVDLKSWERDPEAYDRNASLNQRINTRFYDMISALVAAHMEDGPVYITQEIAVNRDGQDSELNRLLASRYQFVPRGLVFRVTTDRSFQEAGEVRLVTRGLADRTIRFEAGDVVMQKVLPVYLSMLTNSGRYQAAHARHSEAIEFYKQALALDPGYRPAQQSMSEAQSALRGAAPDTSQ